MTAAAGNPNLFHVLNPNIEHRSSVEHFISSRPELNLVWVEKKSHPTHLETILEWALLNGRRDLALWGGDGTFSRAIQFLFSRDELARVRLALVPVGTGNDFARKLDLHPWTRTAERLDGPMEERLVDVGWVHVAGEKRAFINNAGFGRSAARAKTEHPKPLRDIFQFRPKRIRVEWGSNGKAQSMDVTALFAIFFNAPYFNKGIHFKKDIAADDGALDAVFVPPQSGIRLLAKLAQARLGWAVGTASDVWISGQSFSIRTSEDVVVQVDGETVGSPIREFEVGLDSQALTVLTPN